MKVGTTADKTFNYISALLHGDSGIGKTTSLATLPVNKTVIVGAERGLLPLRNHGFAAIAVDGWKDLHTIFKIFRDPLTIVDSLKDAGFGEDEIKPFAGKSISVLAIDSLSELSEMCKRQIVVVDRKALIAERGKMKGKDITLGIYDDLMTMEDWGLYKTRMSNMISAICHLPLNVIFTCLSDWREDPSEGKRYLTPALNGKIATECPAFFDLVFHMNSVQTPDEKGEKVDTRVWQTFHDGRRICKDSSGILAQYEEPNWTKVFSKILNKKAVKK